MLGWYVPKTPDCAYACMTVVDISVTGLRAHGLVSRPNAESLVKLRYRWPLGSVILLTTLAVRPRNLTVES